MKYLCEFKEFMITEWSIGRNVTGRRSRRRIRANIDKALAARRRLSKTAQDLNTVEGDGVKHYASNIQHQNIRPSLPQTLPRIVAPQPKQPMRKNLLNVQPKPFYRRFF